MKLLSSFSSLPKTVVVGGLATLCDMATLATMIQVLHFEPKSANVPSLAVGSLIQFLGNRYFAFNASQGRIDRQLINFALAEGVSLGLNAFVFYILAVWFDIHYAIARPVGTFIIFIGFSYPVWRWIFRTSEPPAVAAEVLES